MNLLRLFPWLNCLIGRHDYELTGRGFHGTEIKEYACSRCGRTTWK